jgi:hypothetical protein
MGVTPHSPWEVSAHPLCASLPSRLILSKVAPGGQVVVGLKVALTPKAKPGQTITLHSVQRHAASKQIVGGVALHM